MWLYPKIYIYQRTLLVEKDPDWMLKWYALNIDGVILILNAKLASTWERFGLLDSS